jgi:hypothetical protein
MGETHSFADTAQAEPIVWVLLTVTVWLGEASMILKLTWNRSLHVLHPPPLALSPILVMQLLPWLVGLLARWRLRKLAATGHMDSAGAGLCTFMISALLVVTYATLQYVELELRSRLSAL